MKGNHWTVTENVIDMSHVPYVHAGTVGDHAAFTDIEARPFPTPLPSRPLCSPLLLLCVRLHACTPVCCIYGHTSNLVATRCDRGVAHRDLLDAYAEAGLDAEL